MNKPIQSTNGFTLVEMAVVLVIVGLMLGGLMVPISAQIDQRNLSEVRIQITEIKEALIGYALATGQLPCPADPTIATGAAGAGTSNCTTNPTVGVIPWASLGVKETDPWGRRFTYRVTSIYADSIATASFGCTPSPEPTSASFALCSTGDMNIRDASGTNIAIAVPAVIVSHGKNGAGGYLSTGIQIAASTNADELENSDSDATFVDHVLEPNFDDITGWISGFVLLNRMVSANKLP